MSRSQYWISRLRAVVEVGSIAAAADREPEDTSDQNIDMICICISKESAGEPTRMSCV